MKQKSLARFLSFQSDNRKPVLSKAEGSKSCTDLRRSIQNPKWAGVLAIFVLLVGCVGMAHAQQSGKVARIGFLDAGTASGIAVLLEAFRQEMGNLGWIEGKNIVVEYRFAEGKI
jgi:hypothetical protein